MSKQLFWSNHYKKTSLYVHEKLERNPFVGSGYLISIAPESPAWLMSKEKDKGQLISNLHFFSPMI